MAAQWERAAALKGWPGRHGLLATATGAGRFGVVKTLAEIEAALAALPEAEFRELMRRVNQRRPTKAGKPSRPVEADLHAGQLSSLVEQVEDDLAEGPTSVRD